MNFRKVYSAEGACCLGGLPFLAVAFVSDLAPHPPTDGGMAGPARGGFFLRGTRPGPYQFLRTGLNPPELNLGRQVSRGTFPISRAGIPPGTLPFSSL